MQSYRKVLYQRDMTQNHVYIQTTTQNWPWDLSKLPPPPPSYPIENVQEKFFANILLRERGQVAAPIYRGSRAKFFSWTICKHDFGPYPSDRELFYDIAFFVVRLFLNGDKRGEW